MPVNRRGKTCPGKAAYPSPAAAEAGLERLAAHGVAVSEMTTYRCTACQRWHNGHPAKWAPRQHPAHRRAREKR